MLATIAPTSTWYLILGAVLFGIGMVGVLVRRNPLIMFMSIELMLNAVNLTFVALSTQLTDINGQTAVFFVLVVAAVGSCRVDKQTRQSTQASQSSPEP